MPERIALLLISLALLGNAPLAYSSDEYQSHEIIEQSVVEYLQDQSRSLSDASITVRPVSNRLRLKKCDALLELSTTNQGINNASGKVTVAVQCPGSTPWTIYVSADITVFDSVVVAKTSISRGTLLSQQNVALKKIAIPSSRQDFYYALSDVLGLKASRSISAETPINDSLTEKQILIKRGQILNIRYALSGIEISMTGKALMDGSKGEIIKVENTTSEKIIDGIVQEKGVVIVK